MPLVVMSYSHSDWQNAEIIAGNLERAYNSEFWYDKGLIAGQKWNPIILTNIAGSKSLVFLISKESLESPHCQEELDYARTHGIGIIPVLVRRLDLTLIPAWLAEIQRIDVSNHHFGATEMTELFVAIDRAIKSASATSATPPSNPNVSIIEAGPGTGKTTYILNHVETLVANGVSAKEILLLTFSRRTAEEMNKRIQQHFPAMQAAGIEASTLHAYSLRIIMSANVLPYIGRRSRILSEFESRFMLYDINVKRSDWDFNDCKRRLDAYEAAWAREPLQEPWKHGDVLDKQFFVYMSEWLLLHEGLLLDELIPLALNYVVANPINSFTSSLKHVVVDEFQDLNIADQTLVSYLAKSAELLIVGDRNQSIYKNLRYAFPEGIDRVSRQLGAKINSLGPSYRCPTAIITAANSLITRNTFRSPHQLMAASSATRGLCTVVQWRSMGDEIAGIAELIEHRVRNDGILPQDVLVLCTTGDIATGVVGLLNGTYGIPSISYFSDDIIGKNLQQKFEVAEAITLLNLLRKSEDRVSYRCWLGYGDKQLAASQYQVLLRNCAADESPRDALQRLIRDKSSVLKKVKYLVKREDELQSKLDELAQLDLGDQIEYVFHLGFQWPKRLQEVVDSEYDSLDEIYEKIVDLISKLDIPQQADHVRVMSLYSSKGLEAKLVIVCGCVDALIPTVQQGLDSKELVDHLEEQRRLFYVAITRTKSELVLSAPATLPGKLLHRRRASITTGNTQRVNTSSFVSNDLAGSLPPVVLGKFW